jgi:murein DD-endopeptidase MepM/ murein hydrolase activator NlpD
MPFPLPFIPKLSYRVGGRRFGADRSNGRKHAGCDLIAPVGTEIFAVADGTVIDANPTMVFYHGTHSITIQHVGFVARYCEVSGFADGIRRGKTVKAGELIAYVGRMFTTSMLHFEVYAGTLTGPLTAPKNKPYKRRSDIINPTALLDQLASHVLESHDPIEPIASAGAAK